MGTIFARQIELCVSRHISTSQPIEINSEMFSITEKKIILLVIIIAFLMNGCSANKRPIQNLSTHNIPPNLRVLEDAYWWRCRFKNVWHEGVAPDLVIDLLLAHAVVAPVLVKNINDIPYWRFHRRANRDSAGHQFSLLFYSKPEIASTVFLEINQSDMLAKAIADNLVEKVIVDDPNHPQFPGIEDTSDHHWSLDLQKNWPSFIMGVSSLWLGLIEDSMQNSPENFKDPHWLLEQYRKVDTKITNIWKKEGQHALLHHLNAVFGYEPLYIIKELSF